MVSIYSGITHNFIHKRLIEQTHYYVHPLSNFQIMIANEGMMLCGGHYHLITHIFSIDMGGCDIVLRGEWICRLGPITINFKELYLSFTHNSHTYTCKRIPIGSPKIISSRRMEQLLKKGHLGVVAKFNAI